MGRIPVTYNRHQGVKLFSADLLAAYQTLWYRLSSLIDTQNLMFYKVEKFVKKTRGKLKMIKCNSKSGIRNRASQYEMEGGSYWCSVDYRECGQDFKISN